MNSEENCFMYTNCNHKDCDSDFCIRKYKLDYLYNSSLLSNKQRKYMKLFIDDNGADLEEFKQLADIEKNIENFVAEGKNLYIYSNNAGNGKTSWSVRFIQTYLNRIWASSELSCRALFVSVPRFMNELKNNITNYSEYAHYVRDNILNADLVVFDDIGAQKGSDYEIQQLMSYIDSRIALGKANIYTSNLGYQDIQNMLGARLASRVYNYSKVIKLNGADKRVIGGDK